LLVYKKNLLPSFLKQMIEAVNESLDTNRKNETTSICYIYISKEEEKKTCISMNERTEQILNWLRCSQRYFPMRIEIEIRSHASRDNDCHPSTTLKITQELKLIYKHAYEFML